MSYWEEINEEEKKIPLELWLMATRPKTLLAGLSPIIIGESFAYYEKSDLNYSILILTILCTVLMQIGTNLVNDYFDGTRGIDGPNRLGPKRVTSNKLIAPEKMRLAFIAVFSLAFILGLFLIVQGGLKIAFIGIISIFIAYAYTAPPFNLSYFALGELLAFIFFGPIAVWGSYYLQLLEKGKLSIAVIIGSFIPGLISSAILAINNLRDRESDMLTPKSTLAIIFGERIGRAIILSLVFLPILVTWMMPSLLNLRTSTYLLMTGITPFIFWKTWKKIAFNKIDESLNFCLFKTSKYLLIFSILFSLAIIWGK